MATLDLNQLFKTAQENGDLTPPTRDPLPPGQYEAVVQDAELKVASTGKDMIKLTFNVVDERAKGRLLWNNLTITPDNPKAMGLFFRNLATLGLGEEWFQGGATLEQTCAALVGRQAILAVTQGTYNGEPNNNITSMSVSKLNPPAAATVAAAAPAKSATGAPMPPAKPF